MKILVVCPHYFPEPFSITEVAEGLTRRGHDVFVVTNHPNYGYGKILDEYVHRDDEVINGVRVHRCKVYPRKDDRLSRIKNYLSFWHESTKYIRRLKEKFDVVYSMTLSPVISVVGANVYAKKHHVPHYLHCLDLWPESTVVTGAVKRDSLEYKILYRWSKRTYSRATEIMVSSPSFEEYFRDVLKLKDIPITYVPQPAMIPTQIGENVVYSHQYNVVYAGNIGTLQLVENLVEAIAIVKEKKDICLHLIGMGTRSAAVQKLIKEKWIEDRVIFYGTRPRGVAAAFYPNASGIVVTLHGEGPVGKTLPAKLTSSLSCGRPIVGYITGDGRKVLDEANGAFMAKGESKEELADALLELCSHSKEELDEIGRRNSDYFDKHFALEDVLTRIENKLKTK